MHQSLTWRECAAAIVLTVLAAVVAAPVGAQPPADTISIVKEADTPSNAELAVRLSEETPLPDTSTVVIGRDDEFADSLASGVLQSTSPLLLVPRGGPVPERVRAELVRLAPQRVLLLGGVAALEPAVEDELREMGFAVERRAGASRFETATAIAGTDAAGADTAILARAFPAQGATDPTQGFADALAAGGLAAEFGWPVLLTQTEVLTAPTREYLVAAGISTVKLMGGTAAISQTVEDELVGMGIAVQRLAGGSRAETAIEVAKERGADSAADAAHVLLVQGQTADAWAGGFAAAAHSALLDAPIVLAVETQLPPATVAWLQDGVTGGPGFAVHEADGAVLTCVTVPSLCEDARIALGLPPTGFVTFDPAPGSPVRSSQQITATFASPVGPEQVFFGGTCASSNSALPSGGSRTQVILAVDVDTPPGPCTFAITYTPTGGTAETVEVSYDHTGEPSLELLSRTPQGVSSGGAYASASRDGASVAFVNRDPMTGLTHSYLARGGAVEMLDVTPEGTASRGDTTFPIGFNIFVAADGRHVAFLSPDGTLDPDTTLGNSGENLYVRDLQAGTTRHVSIGLTGEPVSRADRPTLSADGRVLSYHAQGRLDPQTTCTCIWIRDLVLGTVDVVRAPDATPVAGGGRHRSQLSADGRFLVLQTDVPLVAGDDNDSADVYLYEIATQAFELVSVAPDGTAADDAAEPTLLSGISEDARYIAFSSFATGLEAGQGAEDTGQIIYLRDRQAGTTTRIGLGGTPTSGFTSELGRVQMSDDGAWVVFISKARALEGNKAGCGVYRYNVAGGLLDRVDLGQVGIAANNCHYELDVADSGAVVFDHFATLHAGDDSNNNIDGRDVYRSGAGG